MHLDNHHGGRGEVGMPLRSKSSKANQLHVCEDRVWLRLKQTALNEILGVATENWQQKQSRVYFRGRVKKLDPFLENQLQWIKSSFMKMKPPQRQWPRGEMTSRFLNKTPDILVSQHLEARPYELGLGCPASAKLCDLLGNQRGIDADAS